MEASFDYLEIRRFYRAGFEATPENEAKFETLPKKGLLKLKETFFEYFINGKSLSQTLTEQNKLKEPLTVDWVGAFGSHLTREMERIKINQLLLKPTPEEQIKKSFPQRFENSYLNGFVQRYKEELSNDNVLIYICGECGDYACGGVNVKVSKNATSFIWAIESNDEEIARNEQGLSFCFEKHQYYQAFSNYQNIK